MNTGKQGVARYKQASEPVASRLQIRYNLQESILIHMSYSVYTTCYDYFFMIIFLSLKCITVFFSIESLTEYLKNSR